jgi:uncharacterized protein (DUF1330 family)
MAAYVLANVEVIDAAGFTPYREAVPATIAKYGGKYLARGGAATAVEGTGSPKRVVLLEFPTLAQARTWLESPEYQPLIDIRQRTAKSDIWLIEGVSP